MLASTVISRAMSALNKKTVYESPGRMPSFDASVWPQSAKCDCSGFVDWCMRFSPNRRVEHPLYVKVNGGWFETTAIHADAVASTGYFSQIADARPGAILVYPDYVAAGKKHDGHIGIVIAAKGKGIVGVTQIIHCSSGAWKRDGDAVSVTDSSIWQAHSNAVIAWFDGLEA